MNFIYLIVSCIYGVLSIVAGISQMKSKNLNIKLNCILGMTLGGILVMGSNLKMLMPTSYLFFILILGLVVLHISAIINGFLMHGKLNLRHHFIRLMVSIMMVVLLKIQ